MMQVACAAFIRSFFVRRRAARTNHGRADPIGFLFYSLEGFVDGLREHFVYNEFRRYALSSAMRRRREVALILGQTGNVIPRIAIRDLRPDVVRLYSTKTAKTLIRDLNRLVEKDFLEITEGGYRIKISQMHAFGFPHA